MGRGKMAVAKGPVGRPLCRLAAQALTVLIRNWGA